MSSETTTGFPVPRHQYVEAIRLYRYYRRGLVGFAFFCLVLALLPLVVDVGDIELGETSISSVAAGYSLLGLSAIFYALAPYRHRIAALVRAIVDYLKLGPDRH